MRNHHAHVIAQSFEYGSFHKLFDVSATRFESCNNSGNGSRQPMLLHELSCDRQTQNYFVRNKSLELCTNFWVLIVQLFLDCQRSALFGLRLETVFLVQYLPDSKGRVIKFIKYLFPRCTTLCQEYYLQPVSKL